MTFYAIFAVTNTTFHKDLLVRWVMPNIKDRFPIGTVVTYHGYRLPVRVGQIARVIGYKDANGLYVIWAARPGARLGHARCREVAVGDR